MDQNKDYDKIDKIISDDKDVVSSTFNGLLTGFSKTIRHSHLKAQLLYVKSGILNCEINGIISVVPAQTAVLIESNLPHSVFGEGSFDCISIYFAPDSFKDIEYELKSGVIEVRPLLRELIFALSLVEEKTVYSKKEINIIKVLLDEISVARFENYFLPLPYSIKLKKIIDLLLKNITFQHSTADIAKTIGMSERNFTRKFSQETGMSFTNWKQQFFIIYTLKRISQGSRIKEIAYDLGYNSSSSFITMFKKKTGKSPLEFTKQNKT